ncbi:hypothetical protein [Lentzea sp. NEAU-D7]|uniref:hypothetical protein n=1 Tax=Lentzea sp. NEAU-D7 TaxID=2994667 RepID=UPI00224B07DA|nr:hypothetical protein [Lentzea sp. NEAU-D7]MCX2953577.1 hypothetical protein [Lentzea sp. NEAU-D7]
MKKFLSDFSTDFLKIFLSIAAVVGLYFGALDVQLLKWFWITLGAAVAFTLVKWVFPRSLDAANRYREHPELVKRNAELEKEIVSLNQSVIDNSADYSSYAAIEGRFQAMGQLLAAAYPTDLKIVSVKSDDDIIFLSGKWHTRKPVIGTRLCMVRTGDHKSIGVVQVVSLHEDTLHADMLCVDPSDFAFWNAIRNRATHDFQPPRAVELRPFTLDVEWGSIDPARYRIPKVTEKSTEDVED